MPRADKLKRWNPPEIIEVLTFINDNFDTWFENRFAACTQVVATAKLDRDAKSVYNKVRVLIKPMEDYLRTKKKLNPNDIIWENKKIGGLVKDICKKTRAREGREDKNQMDMDIIDLESEKPDGTVNNLDNLDNDSLDTLDTLDNHDAFNENFIKEIRDLTGQIKQKRSELNKMETELEDKKKRMKYAIDKL